MRLRVFVIFLALVGASCSAGNEKGPAAGAGRLTGQVGPGRPEGNGVVPALTLTFRDGKTSVKTTVQDGVYSVDLPAGTWDVHSDDGDLCATGLRVAPGASQRNDLLWPTGSCQDHSGPPGGPTPPAGPTPPTR
jgi:hypothetical protein